MFKQGEIVEVSTSTQLFKGVFINEEKDFLILKLKNGYNIGIAKRNIKEQKSVGAAKAELLSAKIKDFGTQKLCFCCSNTLLLLNIPFSNPDVIAVLQL